MMMELTNSELNIQKDSRNKRGNDGYKKRNNLKEAVHRH